MRKMKILSIIPARGGSKGVPNKNIVDIAGYPLVSYSIVTARMSRYIERIVVSTDNKKIAKIAKQYGAEVPFLRPKGISSDSSLDIDFFKHALDWLEKKENYVPDLVVHLRPTTPLRNYKIVDKAVLKIIENKEATSLRSGHIAEETPYKLFKIKDNYCDFFGKCEFSQNEEYYNYPRQKFPQTYVPNGYVDIIKPSTIKEFALLHGKKILAFITEKIPDIDTFDDLNYVNDVVCNKKYSLLLNKMGEVKRNSRLS